MSTALVGSHVRTRQAGEAMVEGLIASHCHDMERNEGDTIRERGSIEA